MYNTSPYGLTLGLLITATCIGLGGYVITSRFLPHYISVPVTLIKVSLPLFYFAFFFSGHWNFIDDFIYLNQAQHLRDRGFNVLTVLVDPQGWQILAELAGGIHVLYIWWTLLSQMIFGPYYYAPVFMNVGVTFITGLGLAKLAQSCGFGSGYTSALAGFFLVHWDVLAWSSILNAKDTLILTLTIWSLLLMILIVQKATLPRILALALLFGAFFFIRFYIPILMLIATTWWALQYLPFRRKWQLLTLVIVMGVLLFTIPRMRGLIIDGLLRLSFDNLIPGILRFILTPQPWSIKPKYTFLVIPAVLHWLFYPITIMGIWLIWNRSRYVALIIIYFMILLLLYGSYDVLQGVRQRFQISFIIAWGQFHILWLIGRGTLHLPLREWPISSIQSPLQKPVIPRSNDMLY